MNKKSGKQGKKRKKYRRYVIVSGIVIAGLAILTAVLIHTARQSVDKEENLGKNAWNASESETEDVQTGNDAATGSHEAQEKELTEEEKLALEEQKKAEQKNAWIEEKIASMTVEEKVGQLFFITPEALTGYDTVTQAGDVTRQAYEQYPVGGIIFFQKNVTDPDQLLTMTSNLQSFAVNTTELPVFLGIDEEGGKVTRIASNSNFSVEKFQNMREIGKTGDASKAYEVGDTIGAYLNQYGLNLDFAPDADVLTNPDNPVIGVRSFGSDASLVADMDVQVLDGLAAHQVYGCLKHFPGHGDTSEDSHNGAAFSYKTLEELEEAELVPFQKGIDEGVKFIMVSHISLPNVTGDQMPASLSNQIITGILREQMGYDGIVITDAMNMSAVTDSYGSSAAAVKAINAGVDIVLMPVDFKAAYQGVLTAVSDGSISEERLEQSLRRILTVKYEMLEQEL